MHVGSTTWRSIYPGVWVIVGFYTCCKLLDTLQHRNILLGASCRAVMNWLSCAPVLIGHKQIFTCSAFLGLSCDVLVCLVSRFLRLTRYKIGCTFRQCSHGS